MRFDIGPFTVRIYRRVSSGPLPDATLLMPEEFISLSTFEYQMRHISDISRRMEAGETIVCELCNVALTHAPMLESTCTACLHGHCEKYGTMHT